MRSCCQVAPFRRRCGATSRPTAVPSARRTVLLLYAESQDSQLSPSPAKGCCYSSCNLHHVAVLCRHSFTYDSNNHSHTFSRVPNPSGTCWPKTLVAVRNCLSQQPSCNQTARRRVKHIPPNRFRPSTIAPSGRQHLESCFSSTSEHSLPLSYHLRLLDRRSFRSPGSLFQSICRTHFPI
jgi:hypothetical protein